MTAGRKSSGENGSNLPGKPAGDAPPLSEREIADRIVSAVMEQRLPPGTKLSENVLCDAFSTSRARVRRVLLMLAERDVVDLHSNRGAFVAQPSVDNARNVFAARRAIEPAITRAAAERATKVEIATLRRHVDAETSAQAGNHGHDAIRLSGAFHVTLAEIGGNPVLTRIVADLVARSSLIIGLFGAADTSCSEGDHRTLVGAIAKHDGPRAAALMESHLTHIEKDLELADIGPATIDLRAVLAVDGRRASPGHGRL